MNSRHKGRPVRNKWLMDSMKTPLAKAIEDFNSVFAYDIDPLVAHTPAQLQTMCDVARLRGRGDIADGIDQAHKEAVPAAEVDVPALAAT